MDAKPSSQIPVRASLGLADWLWEEAISVIVSAYQSGQLISISASAPGKLAAQAIRFDRSMGLAKDRNGLWVATLNRIWRFSLMRGVAKTERANDAYVVPQVSYMTGYANVHDLAIGPQQRPIFAAAAFNCIATTTVNSSLLPLWYPDFIRDRALGDACHLNGLALRNGVAQYATVLAESGEAGAWRKNADGGALIDIASNRPVMTGLSQPHSPRFYGDRLWLHQSSRGAFGHIDGNRYIEVLRCPGYLRGLAFHKGFACMGMSKPRGLANTGGRALSERLKAHNLDPVCGVLFFDLEKGTVVHSLQLKDLDEVYDVAVLNCRDPYLVDPASLEASTTYLMGEPARAERMTEEPASD